MDSHTPAALKIPLEIRYIISELLPTESLISLARAHSSFQKAAERVLYRRLAITISSDLHANCTETIANNSEKAGYVRFLSLDSRGQWVKGHPNEWGERKTRIAMGRVLQALEDSMYSVVDLRIQLDPHRMETWVPQVRRLGKILRTGKYKRLNTLYCNAGLNFFEMAKKCPDMRIFGVHISGSENVGPLLDSLRKAHNYSKFTHLPLAFTLGWDWSNTWDRISIFPAFYPADRFPTMPEEIKSSLENTSTKYVKELTMYLHDLSDISSITELAKRFFSIFPNITHLKIYTQVCYNNTSYMKKMVPSFPRVIDLSFYSWPRKKVQEDGKIIYQTSPMATFKFPGAIFL